MPTFLVILIKTRNQSRLYHATVKHGRLLAFARAQNEMV